MRYKLIQSVDMHLSIEWKLFPPCANFAEHRAQFLCDFFRPFYRLELADGHEVGAVVVAEPDRFPAWLRWILLAFAPSSLMLGATTYISTDLAAFPLLQFANAVPWTRLGVPAWIASYVDYAVLAWIVVVLVRSVYVALEYVAWLRPLRALLGGLLLAAPIWYASSIAPVDPWFAPVGRGEADPRYPSPASRLALFELSLLVYLLLCKLLFARRTLLGEVSFLAFFAFGLSAMALPSLRAAKRGHWAPAPSVP